MSPIPFTDWRQTSSPEWRLHTCARFTWPDHDRPQIITICISHICSDMTNRRLHSMKRAIILCFLWAQYAAASNVVGSVVLSNPDGPIAKRSDNTGVVVWLEPVGAAVLPTPYFALTGADGRFQIQVPPGAYKLEVWNEHGQPESLSRLEQRITVGSDDVKLPEIQIRQGLAQSSHSNKYGQPYFSTTD